MKRMIMVGAAGALVLGGVVVACQQVSNAVQNAPDTCSKVAWAVPLVQVAASLGKLNPTEQQLLASGEKAVSDCAAGNVTASATDVLNGLLAILYPPKP